MRQPVRLAACAFLAAALVLAQQALFASQAASFLRDMANKAAAAMRSDAMVVSGADGWLFFAPELRSLGVGRFWGPAAAKASSAPDKAYADPLPAILDFKAQLDRKGIQLLIVPVPPKAVIYPDMISAQLSFPKGTPPPRLDPYHQEFYRLLASKGVRVLDLTPAFLRARDGSAGPLYCRQDTHWSGAACVLAARLIAAEVKKQRWCATVKKRAYVSQPRSVTITGDLWQMLGDASLPKERLTLTFVKERTPSGLALPTTWRQSPVLLLGDSHNLVFHGGEDMLAEGAGLADQLALQLGFPVDLVAVRGSGATPARINLLRRGDNLVGKRFVVWCFSAREFTEGHGWRKVPVIR